MNKQIDFSNIGGFPLEEDTLDFMQSSTTGALSAIAKLLGDKVILYGVELVAGNVSDGWISVNGELMPFIGSPVAAKVVITNTGVDAQFEDDVLRTVYYTKVATCGALGDFDFSELKSLATLIDTKTALADLTAAFNAHTHAWSAITDKPNGYITYVNAANIGNPATDQTYTITIPDQATNTYKVFGTLVGHSADPDLDNDVDFILVGATKTATTFQISIREYVNVAQNLTFDFMIVKTL